MFASFLCAKSPHRKLIQALLGNRGKGIKLGVKLKTLKQY
jgi:hypothetical protein